jgi:hypothetical protein
MRPRQIALHYSGTLPDFICTEMVQRANVLAGARSATKDRLTIQLSYFGQQEKYKVVAVDGRLQISLVVAISTGDAVPTRSRRR